MKALLGLVGLLALTACESPWTKLPDVQRDVTVVEVDPPKRLYVTLRDNQNGVVYNRLYVSKRCSKYKQVPVGSRFSMPFHVYEHKENHEVSVEPSTDYLRQIFCN